MPIFKVRLSRAYTVYEETSVEVDAADTDAAKAEALALDVTRMEWSEYDSDTVLEPAVTAVLEVK